MIQIHQAHQQLAEHIAVIEKAIESKDWEEAAESDERFIEWYQNGIDRKLLLKWYEQDAVAMREFSDMLEKLYYIHQKLREANSRDRSEAIIASQKSLNSYKKIRAYLS